MQLQTGQGSENAVYSPLSPTTGHELSGLETAQTEDVVSKSDFESLESIQEINDVPVKHTGTVERLAQSYQSPASKEHKHQVRLGRGKFRRRSTMDWAFATSQVKQKNLETVSATRLADIFVTLHVKSLEEPVYISETVTRTMNPAFRQFSLEDCGPGVTRLEDLIIKTWVTHDPAYRFTLYFERALSLPTLQYLGKDLASLELPFPQNCVIVELMDGYYTSSLDIPYLTGDSIPAEPRLSIVSTRPLPTTSFDALLRLSKMDDNIQSAKVLRTKLKVDMETSIKANSELLSNSDNEKRSRDRLKTIQFAKSIVEKQLRSLRQNYNHKKALLQKRQGLLVQGREELLKGNSFIRSKSDDLNEMSEDLSILSKSITAQQRRISYNLSSIFPINPLPISSSLLEFTIHNLHLPDSESLDSIPPDNIAAALGLVSQLLQLLSFYLSYSLPYTVQPRGSTSTIFDPLSSFSTSSSTSTFPTTVSKSNDLTRIFPLYTRHSGPRYRFEYALFLLNKNIQCLLADRFKIRVLDIKQTLPNLLHVLVCMGSGQGEIPGRKVGSISTFTTGNNRASNNVGLGIV